MATDEEKVYAFNRVDHARVGASVKVTENFAPDTSGTNLRSKQKNIPARQIQRAVTQEDWTTTDGKISVKRFDEITEAAVGIAFDVFIKTDQSAADLADWQPEFTSGSTVRIVRIGLHYYLHELIVEVESCP